MSSRLSDIFLGSRRNIAGTEYGTIIVLAAIVAGAPGLRDEPWRLAVVVVVTAFVFWVAHVYSDGIGESLEQERRLDRAEFLDIARRELAILLAVVGPVLALLLGAIGVVRESSAIWLALGAGIVTLVVQGFRYARLETLGFVGTALSVSVNLAFGLVIVAMKVFISH